MERDALLVSFAVLVTTSFLLFSASVSVLAKPVAPNPEHYWATPPDWGTKLKLENSYTGNAWIGGGSSDNNSLGPAPPDGMRPILVEGGTEYSEITKDESAPQSYVWDVKFESYGAAPGAGTLSWVLENSTHVFVPSDFSLVLENSSTFGSVNLRAVDNVWVSFPSRASFYADNAVNVSVSPDSQSVIRGGDLSYDVTVSNTGRYDDVYDLSADSENGWSVDVSPSVLSVPAGGDNSATLTVTTQAGMDEVTVLADGDYADDEVSCTAEGKIPVADVSILPHENVGLSGENVKFDVTVTNTSGDNDNFDLIASDNKGWEIELENDNFINMENGENRVTKLTVTISENATYCTQNLVTVTAVSEGKYSKYSDNAMDNCVAHATNPVELYDGFGGFVGGFENIQSAVNASYSNYSVLVHPGNYQENVMINVPNLTLQSSDGANSTIIESQGEDPEFGVAIDDDNVRLQGFTIEGGLPLVAGIESPENVTGTIIENVMLRSDNGPGILSVGGDMTIANSTIDGADVTVGGGIFPITGDIPMTGGIFALASDIDISDSKIINWNGDNCVAIVLNPPLSPAPPARLVMENCRIENSNAGAIGFSNSNLVIENSVIDGTGAIGLGGEGPSSPIGIIALDNSELVVSGSEIVNWNHENSMATVIGNPGPGPSKPSSMSIVDSLVENNFIGVMVGENGSLLAKFTSFENNSAGIAGSDYASIEFCSFLGNDNGVLNLGGDPTWNARKNWWGDSSGPSGFGPGSGDKVSDNVAYTPWLGGPISKPESDVIEVGSNSEELDNIGVELDSTGEGEISAVKIDNLGGVSLSENKLQAGMFFDISTVPENIAENVQVTLHYSDGDVEGIVEENLKLYYWNRQGENWQVMENITVDSGANIVTGYISHLTLFTALGPSVPAVPPEPSVNRGVDITISPSGKSGASGETLSYTVTVTNTGEVSDSYNLEATGVWPLRFSDASITVASGYSSSVILRVSIPEETGEGDVGTFTVEAVSEGDPEVSDSDSCSATVSPAVTEEEERPPVGGMPPKMEEESHALPLIIIIVAIGIIVLSVGYMLKLERSS